MNTLKRLLVILIAVLLFPAFYFFFNASIRDPDVAFVAAIPFVMYAIVRSRLSVRTSYKVLVWVSATAWVLYGFWEQHIFGVRLKTNIRVDLFGVFAVLYTLTLSCIWVLLFHDVPTMRSSEPPSAGASGSRSP
jgi:hypothetical protein